MCLRGSGTILIDAERLQISDAPRKQNKSIWNHSPQVSCNCIDIKFFFSKRWWRCHPLNVLDENLSGSITPSWIKNLSRFTGIVLVILHQSLCSSWWDILRKGVMEPIIRSIAFHKWMVSNLRAILHLSTVSYCGCSFQWYYTCPIVHRIIYTTDVVLGI